MIEDILFLLWVFIRPIITLGCRFFQRIKVPNPKQFFTIFTLVGYFIFSINFIVAPFIIAPVSEVPLNTVLKWSVMAEVIIFDLKIFVEFLIKLTKDDPKRILKLSFFAFNTLTVVLGFLWNDFSNPFLISIILLYPLSALYQIGMYYLELKKIKNIKSWKDVITVEKGKLS